MGKTPQYHIRYMIRQDMSKVLDIESASFEFPWTEKDFHACLRERGVVGTVAATDDDRVLGYAVYERLRKEVNLLSLAVAKGDQRKGVGTMLVKKITGELSPARRNRVIADVRETNDDAIGFLRALDFRAVGLLQGYYADGRSDCQEDAYRFVYKLDVTKNRISHLFRKRSAT